MNLRISERSTSAHVTVNRFLTHVDTEHFGTEVEVQTIRILTVEVTSNKETIKNVSTKVRKVFKQLFNKVS